MTNFEPGLTFLIANICACYFSFFAKDNKSFSVLGVVTIQHKNFHLLTNRFIFLAIKAGFILHKPAAL